MDKYIVLEFSGWAKIDPKDARFVAIENNIEDCIDGGKNIISGSEWLELDATERSWYILEDAIAFQRDALDGEYTSLDILVEAEDDE